MQEILKYFIFNKPLDYLRGYLYQMEVDAAGLHVIADTGEKAVFLSRVLDSREEEMDWHRLEIQGNEREEAAFRLSVYSSNNAGFLYEEKETAWEDLIRREDISVEEKCRCMAPYLRKQVISMDDVLLHEVRGRYLWIMLEMYQQKENIALHDMKISFPRQTWMEYLPEIYRQADDKKMFLERYLGIFQTMYEDLGQRIQESAQLFDMELAEGKFLNWLAEWIAIEESYIWSEEQLRRLLADGISLYKRRGTRQGVIDFVTLYTGERPFLLEAHQLQYFRKDRKQAERLHRLYGSNPYSFTVLVREEVLHSVQKQKTLIQIIEGIKPVHMELNLVMIKPYIFLDGHSYLGVNSILGKYTDMALDGHSVIPFTFVGEKVTVNSNARKAVQKWRHR